MSYKSNNKIRHPPVQQQSPFSMGEYAQQAPLQRSPETIMIECNRQNALYEGAGKVGLDSQNNTWLSEFSSGLQLRAGDEVKVHSAFLSSVGVGDLIAWNRDETSINQDNKGTWIYSFYGCNDAKNDKREQYNMTLGAGVFPYDVDNRPCKLLRNLPNGLDTTANFADRPNSSSYTYYQDPYCPARIIGEIPTTKQQEIGKNQLPLADGNFRLSFVNNVIDESTPPVYLGQSVLFLDQYKAPATTPPTYDAYDVRKLFSIGKSYKFYPLQLDVDEKTAPALGYYNYNSTYAFIFTIYGFIDLTANTNYNEWGAIMENQNYLNGINYDVGGDNKTKIMLSTGYFQEVNIGGNYSYQSQSPTHLISNPQVPPNRPLATTFSSLNQISQVGDEVFMVYTPTINQATPAIPSSGKVLYEEDELVLFQVIESPNTNIVLDVLFTHLFNPADGTDHSYIVVEFLNLEFPLRFDEDLLALNNGLNTFGFYLNGEANDNEFMTVSTIGGGGGTWGLVSENVYQFTNVLRSVNAPDSDDNYRPNQKGKCILYGMLNNVGFKYRHKGKANQSITSNTPQLNVPANGEKDLYTMINTKVLIDNFGSVTNAPSGLLYSSIAYPETTTTIRASSFAINIRDSGGLNPIDVTKYSRTINGADSFISQLNLFQHYSTYTFNINEDYSSPSDIATELTRQTHAVTSPRNNFGNLLPESIIGQRQIISVPQNNFLIPVWTSSINDDALDNKESATGLTNTLATGSFVLESNIYDIPKEAETTAPPNGKSYIYFRTKYTSYNKPTNGTETDFNQSGHPIYSAIYNSAGTAPADEIGYPLEYIPKQNCFMSQYMGTDNIAFSWDTTQSRFIVSYLHQPQVSTFSVDDKTGVETGGQESCILYFPEPTGTNGYLYKLPQTRNGGVNIENWLSYDIKYGMTPDEIRSLTGIDDSVDLSTDWFLGGVDSINKSNLSERFWSKLGFSEAQFNNVGYDVETTSGNFIPKATTDGLIDVASGIITLEEPSEDTPFYITKDSAETTAKEVRYAKSSIGALNTNGHAKGYGHANTSGQPLQFTGTPTTDTYLQGALTFNPDRQRRTGYTIDCVSTELIAKNLPTKTENGYFLILSDLVDTEFYVSANKGSNLNCVGIISKLNAEGDFYYQYQAPQSFYIKKDKLISSITIDIRQPDLSTPNAISPYSSVLFQITRYQPMPQSIPQPIWTQQQEFYANLTNSLQQIIQQNKPAVKTPERTRLAEIMNQVSSAILQPKTQETEPNLIQRIINNYDRMNLNQYKDDPQGLRQFLLANPEASGFLDDLSTVSAQAPLLPTDPEELTEEGLFNYVSQYQPPSDDGTPAFLPDADPTIGAKTPAQITQFIIDNQKQRLLNDQRPLGADDIASMLGAGATPSRIESLTSLGQKMEKNMREARSGENESRAMDLETQKQDMIQMKSDRYKEYRERGGLGQFSGEKKEDLALQDRLSRQAGRPPADRPSFYIKPPAFNEGREDDEDE